MADKHEDKPKPKCGQCMDSGIIVVTYITDDGAVGTYTRTCSH